MKKFALIPFLFVFAVVAILIWFFINTGAVSTQTTYVNFDVLTGDSAVQIGRNLQSAGLIKNSTAFKFYAQFSGLSNRIQAGDYRLSPSFNLFQIVDTLAKAPVEVRVTIPEGLRREEIADRFAKNLDQNQGMD